VLSARLAIICDCDGAAWTGASVRGMAAAPSAAVTANPINRPAERRIRV
jgi:hypothetical protein